MARSLFHERNTASIARCSCVIGSCGKGLPVCSRMTRLYASMVLPRTASASSCCSAVSLCMSVETGSNASFGTSRTTDPNICRSLRYESNANRCEPLTCARPCTEASFNPTFSTVSIMPGMEMGAPERTLTSSGSCSLPKFLPACCSSQRKPRSSSAGSSAGNLPASRYARQTSVVTVTPGGTGTESSVISARPAPLPPRSSRMDPSPSTAPAPKRYTCLEKEFMANTSERIQAAQAFLSITG